MKYSVTPHTDFRGAGVSVEKHAAAIRYATSTAEEAASYRLARLHSLESKVSSHGLRDIIAVVAVLDAFLSNVLYLGSPVYVLAKPAIYLTMLFRTCSETRSVPSAQSC